MKFWRLVSFFTVAILLVSCQENTDKKDIVVNLPKDDPTFLALKDTAQSYMQMFIDSVVKHGTDEHFRFAIKSDFVENGVHEHMWSRIYAYNDGKFIGLFVDSALDVKNIQPGDSVKVASAAVDDWSIYDSRRNAKMGDFSDAYLRSKKK